MRIRPRWGKRRQRQSGIVLADFMAGMFLFSATMIVFAELTHSKFEMLGASHLRARALGVAEEAIDKVRLEGLPGLPMGKADKQGFRRVGAFSTRKQLVGGKGVISARALMIVSIPTQTEFPMVAIFAQGLTTE